MTGLPCGKTVPWMLLSVSLLFAPPPVNAQTAEDKGKLDLPGFRTVETAIAAKISKAGPTQTSSPGYLGVSLNLHGTKLVISDIEDQSPARKAGLQVGDELLKIDAAVVKNPEVFRSWLQMRNAGETIELTIQRKKNTLELSATLVATSRVMVPGQKRATMGVQFEDENDGAKVTAVSTGLPADKAGLKVGDLIRKVDGKTLSKGAPLSSVLADHKPGDTLRLLIKPLGMEKDREAKVVLTAEPDKGFKGKKGAGGAGGWDTRGAAWKKNVYRLAIVCIDYPDVKPNEKITPEHWEEALFSTKTYVNTSATGQRVFGSLNDYYQEQSFGKLRVEGRCFDYVTVSKKRSEYGQSNSGAAKTALLVEALDLLYKRDGDNALKSFDGIFFLYAGESFKTNRGGLYWPHKASFNHQGNRWPYYIVHEGGAKMCDISVICHEFGHMLGLPDLYARPENPGSEGLGAWCAMSNQVGGGKPQHFCAWSKEQLGWINPVVLDPTFKQKLVLSPIENSAKECFKVLVRPDGSEYFLLENRKKKGFDASLPGEGLLIWRVVHGKPILEESHGVEGPQGPRVFLDAVPFPSVANRSFTPFTTPSSRAQLGGGLPVHITNIRRLPDGRITFFIGYEYY